MQINRMNQEDIASVVRLEQMIFSDPWNEAMLKASLESQHEIYFTAKEGERLIGYAGLSFVIPEGEIHRIAVDPLFRRQKAGAALMEELVISARRLGITDILLEVRYGNLAAVSLYECCGFKKAGLRKGYYKRPDEDALIMCLKLI